MTNFLRGTKARVAQHPRKRLPPTSHTLEEANLGAEPSYGMGMCHKSVQMHPEKKNEGRDTLCHYVWTFFLESLMFRNVQHVLTFHGRTFATLQVGEENGQQAAGIQVLAPAFQGRVGTWQGKIGDV